MAIFATFQNLVIFRILGVFSSRLLHRTTLMCFLTPFAVILVFFLNTSENRSFCVTIAEMRYGYLCHFSKSCHLSNIRRFFQPFAAWNNFNVFLESFCCDFGTFKFRPKIGHFALL